MKRKKWNFSPPAHQGRQSDEEGSSLNLRWSEEVALTPFLPRLGKGIEPEGVIVQFGCHYRLRLSCRWTHTPNALLLHLTSLYCIDLLLNINRYHFGDLRRHIVGCSG